MATYKEICAEAERLAGRSIKTCWVAHVLDDCGLKTKDAPNRIDPDVRQQPCPDGLRKIIMEALRSLKMIA
jgi:hypothetical protein